MQMKIAVIGANAAGAKAASKASGSGTILWRAVTEGNLLIYHVEKITLVTVFGNAHAAAHR